MVALFRRMSVRQFLRRVVIYGFSGTSRRPSSLLIFSTRISTGFSIDDGRASGSSLGFIGIFPSTPGVASQVSSTALRFLEAANGNVIFSGCGWLRRCPIWQCAYPIAKRGRVTSIGSVLAVFVLVVRETGYCTAATTNPSFGVICRVVKLGSSLLFQVWHQSLFRLVI